MAGHDHEKVAWRGHRGIQVVEEAAVHVTDSVYGHRREQLSERNLPATVFLKFTLDCATGVEVAVDPAGSAVLVRQAASRDQRIAAAQVQILKTPKTLRLTRPDGTVSTLAVRPGA